MIVSVPSIRPTGMVNVVFSPVVRGHTHPQRPMNCEQATWRQPHQAQTLVVPGDDTSSLCAQVALLEDAPEHEQGSRVDEVGALPRSRREVLGQITTGHQGRSECVCVTYEEERQTGQQPEQRTPRRPVRRLEPTTCKTIKNNK